MTFDHQISPRRLRVAHVVLQLQTGGMERLLADVARLADPNGVEHRFIALAAGGAVADELRSGGAAVEILNLLPGVRPGAMMRLVSLLRRWRVDVVHTHNTRPLIYGAPAARLAGIPVVVYTRHGQRFGASHRQTALFNLAARAVDRVVCVSEDTAAISIAQGIPAHKVIIIRNGIDLDRFKIRSPAPRGPLVMVGRLSPEKNVDSLIRAMALIGSSSACLEIAGNGVCRPGLQRLAEDLGVRSRVKFLGEIRNVEQLLSRASLFVLSSRTEGISLTLLEAMSSGLPVVATKVGGNPEVVAHGMTGLLVPPNDPVALAHAIEQIYGDPEHGAAMGRAGRERVEAHFDVRDTIRAYESVYGAIAQERTRAAA
jgi:glycosyltransferase involved in cell wall biosynthesis